MWAHKLPAQDWAMNMKVIELFIAIISGFRSHFSFKWVKIANVSKHVIKAPSFSGSDVLHSSLDLEELGRRKNANDLRRFAWRAHNVSWRKTSPSRSFSAIPRWQYEHAQHLRVWLLFLRVLERSQCGMLLLLPSEYILKQLIFFTDHQHCHGR